MSHSPIGAMHPLGFPAPRHIPEDRERAASWKRHSSEGSSLKDPELHRQDLSSSSTGELFRASAAVLPNTVELGHLVAMEAGRRAVSGLCDATPTSQKVCRAVERLARGSKQEWSEFAKLQNAELARLRLQHQGVDRYCFAVELLQQVHSASTNWSLKRAQQALQFVMHAAEGTLVNRYQWTEPQAREFVSNSVATSLFLLPGWASRTIKPLSMPPAGAAAQEALKAAAPAEAKLPVVAFLKVYREDGATSLVARVAAMGPVKQGDPRKAQLLRRYAAELFRKAEEVGASHVYVQGTFENSRLLSLLLKRGGEDLSNQALPRWLSPLNPFDQSKTTLRFSVEQYKHISAPLHAAGDLAGSATAVGAAPMRGKGVKTIQAQANLQFEAKRVNALEQSLKMAAPPRGLPSHLGLITESTESIPFHVKEAGGFVRGNLPFVRVQDGAAVLIQRSTSSRQFPTHLLGTERLQNQVFCHRGFSAAQRAEHVVKAIAARAEQEGWEHIYLVWDPKKHPVALTLERLGVTVDAIGDVTKAGTQKKWVKISTAEAAGAIRLRARLGGLFAVSAVAGAVPEKADAQESDWMLQEDFWDGPPHHHQVERSRVFVENQRPAGFAIARRDHLIQVTLAVGDCLIQHAERFPGLIPPRAIQTLQLLTASAGFLQGNVAAIPAVLGAAGALLHQRDMVKVANLAGAVVSTLASRAALMQAATPMAAIVPGLGMALGVAGILHSILSLSDDEDDALDEFLRDLQTAGADLARRVHERLAVGVERVVSQAGSIMESQLRLSDSLAQAHREVGALQDALACHAAQVQERVAVGFGEMQSSQLDLKMDLQTFGQRLAQTSVRVQDCVQSVVEQVDRLQKRDWEEALRNLELFAIRTPERHLSARELCVAIDAIRKALHSSLQGPDYLRVAAAALRLGYEAHRACLPTRQLRPVLQRARGCLLHSLESTAGLTTAPTTALAEELMHLFNLLEAATEAKHE